MDQPKKISRRQALGGALAGGAALSLGKATAARSDVRRNQWDCEAPIAPLFWRPVCWTPMAAP